MRGDKFPESLEHLRESLNIYERLTILNPSDKDWQYDLSIAHGMLGAAHRHSDEFSKARQHLSAGRTIVTNLIGKSPDKAHWKKSLNWFDAQIAELGDVAQ